MRYLMAALAITPFALLLVGMLLGRVNARSCCPVDPARDSRLDGLLPTDRSG